MVKSLDDNVGRLLDELEKAAHYLDRDENDAEILYNTSYFTIGTVNALFARVYL